MYCRKKSAIRVSKLVLEFGTLQARCFTWICKLQTELSPWLYLPTAQFLRASPKFINSLAKHRQACKMNKKFPMEFPSSTKQVSSYVFFELDWETKQKQLSWPSPSDSVWKDSWLRLTQSIVDSLFPMNYSKVISKRFSLYFTFLLSLSSTLDCASVPARPK